MRVRFIDVSGGILVGDLERIAQEVQIGDFVASFDSRVYDVVEMSSQEQIDGYFAALPGGRGTDILPVIETAQHLIEKHQKETLILIYSDMHFSHHDLAAISTCRTLGKFVFVRVGNAAVDLPKSPHYTVRDLAVTPTLYLAEVRLSWSEYPSGVVARSTETRLVRAQSKVEANYKIVKRMTNEDQYSDSTYVEYTVLNEVID